MNKELALRTFAYLIGHYKTNNETTINKQEIEAMEFILKDNESLEQQCKKQKEYNQHLHNLNNTIFRELLDKKYENKKQKEVINKATNELFILKDMIYKPETREENFEIQRKISSIIKRLNGKEVSE